MLKKELPETLHLELTNTSYEIVEFLQSKSATDSIESSEVAIEISKKLGELACPESVQVNAWVQDYLSYVEIKSTTSSTSSLVS